MSLPPRPADPPAELANLLMDLMKGAWSLGQPDSDTRAVVRGLGAPAGVLAALAEDAGWGLLADIARLMQRLAALADTAPESDLIQLVDAHVGAAQLLLKRGIDGPGGGAEGVLARRLEDRLRRLEMVRVQ